MEALESAALIEDYFTVNADDIERTGFSVFDLVPAFCVEGPTVFSFYLTANIFGSRRTVSSVSAKLFVN